MPKGKMISKSNQTKSENAAQALTALSIRAFKHNDAKAENTTLHEEMHISEEQNEPT